MTALDNRNLENNTEDAAGTETTPFWKRRRYFVVLMAFLGLFNVYALRVNLSVAIVAMTENRTIHHDNGSTSYAQDFPWDSKQKGLVLSSFFYGYLLTQIAGGVLAAKIGGNLLFGIGVGVTALLTLITPLAAKWSIYALVAVRIIEGLFEGVTYSSLFEMWSKWAPPFERSRMVTASFAGNYIGIVVSLPVSGILAASVGWESVFYVFGIVGCIWCAFWLIFVKASPATDPWITSEEKQFIESSLNKQTKNEQVKTPWKAIWTSSAVWAIIAAQFSEGWGFFTLQTQLPQFLKDVLDFDLAKSGIVSAIPYMAMAFMLQVAGFLADWVQIKGYLTTRQTRRYFNCLAFVAQTVCMLLAAYFLHPVTSVAFITIGVALASFAYTSFSVNYLDIAPQFAGILMGICNSFATVAGIVSPLLTGYIVTTPNESEWKTILYISAGIYMFGCIVYWIWCQGTIQPWAVQSTNTSVTDEHSGNASDNYAYKNQGLDVKSDD